GDLERAFAELSSRFRGYSETPTLESALAELDALIGLEPVKRQVHEITAQLKVARLRHRHGHANHAPGREHLGSTAIKTNKLVDSALGAVLFIDEAYSLYNEGYSGGDAFGSEAVQTLLKRAEDDRDPLVIVLAGDPAH